jgi:hypothetical protein
MAKETDGGIQAVKAARNQSLWRELNERIKEVAETSGQVEFLCECAKLDCTDTLTLSMADYEPIRSSPTDFPIAVGHEYCEFRDVVEVNDGYAVVRKRGKAGEIAVASDPRSH